MEPKVFAGAARGSIYGIDVSDHSMVTHALAGGWRELVARHCSRGMRAAPAC